MKLVRETKNQSISDKEYLRLIDTYWDESTASTTEKLECFTRYVSRQSLTKFISRYEIFKNVLNIHGSVFEIGVHRGASLFSWAQISSILEPVNYTRKIVGFDTFSGFAGLHDNDLAGLSEHLHQGGFSTGETEERDILNGISLFDANRLMNHIKKLRS